MSKNPFSREKARTVLSEKDPTLHGKPISKKQRGLLGFIAGGGKVKRSLRKS